MDSTLADLGFAPLDIAGLPPATELMEAQRSSPADPDNFAAEGSVPAAFPLKGTSNSPPCEPPDPHQEDTRLPHAAEGSVPAAFPLAGTSNSPPCEPHDPHREDTRLPQSDIGLQPEPVGESLASSAQPVHSGAPEPPHGIAWTNLSPSCTKRLLELPSSQFVLHASFKGRTDIALRFAGSLDLYSGQRGVAKQLVKLGVPWVLCFDWEHDESENLLEPAVQGNILDLIHLRSFQSIGLAPLCTSFSTAVTPPIRSPEYLEGVPWASANQQLSLDQGNRHCQFCTKVLKAATRCGCVFWMENPDNSWLWRQVGLESFIRKAGLSYWRYDACRFSAPWRKRTKVLLNTDLQNTKDLCQGGHEHIVLRGRCKAAGQNWTRVAQVYPLGVCKKLASSVIRAVYASTCCAKANACRIGEVDHPGPARLRAKRDFDLASYSLLEPATDKLRTKLEADFFAWIEAGAGRDSVAVILGCPLLLVEVLRKYGTVLFETEGSLHYYRQLLAHFQRTVIGLRAQLGPAWDVVTKWAIAEPVEHRPPLPEALLQAMVGLSIGLGWLRFATAMLLSYYCIARPGEVLKAVRRDVLTPKDCLEESTSACIYLRVAKPKTRKRGARVQHCKMSVPFVVEFVEAMLLPLSPQDPIYGGSPSSFRRRWDFILRQIGFPARLRVTPSLSGEEVVSGDIVLASRLRRFAGGCA